MLYYRKIIVLVGITILLSACATNREHVVIPPAFLANPKTLAIVQLSGLEKPGYYKIGQQGIFDVLINEAMATSAQEKIEKMDATPIVKEYYYKRFSHIFASQSFEVKEDPTPLNKESLTPPPIKNLKYAPYDFRFLQGRYNVEYALILDPISFGVERSYHGFFPTDAPKGFARVSFYLVNLSNNSIVAECHTAEQDIVKGEWDTPPEYSNLIKSIKAALAKAISGAYIFFF